MFHWLARNAYEFQRFPSGVQSSTVKNEESSLILWKIKPCASFQCSSVYAFSMILQVIRIHSSLVSHLWCLVHTKYILLEDYPTFELPLRARKFSIIFHKTRWCVWRQSIIRNLQTFIAKHISSLLPPLFLSPKFYLPSFLSFLSNNPLPLLCLRFFISSYTFFTWRFISISRCSGWTYVWPSLLLCPLRTCSILEENFLILLEEKPTYKSYQESQTRTILFHLINKLTLKYAHKYSSSPLARSTRAPNTIISGKKINKRQHHALGLSKQYNKINSISEFLRKTHKTL